jgi:hypothetical protein
MCVYTENINEDATTPTEMNASSTENIGQFLSRK